MEVLHVYYARALASVYNEGLYAEMYSIDLAAVSTRDYAFGLNNVIRTHFMLKQRIGGRFNTIGDSLTHTERHLIVTVRKFLNFALR